MAVYLHDLPDKSTNRLQWPYNMDFHGCIPVAGTSENFL